MSEITDDILDGLRCQSCGDWLPALIIANGKTVAPGYPRTCRSCAAEAIRAQVRPARPKR